MLIDVFTNEPSALLSERALGLLDGSSDLSAWVDGFGSPLHVVFPEQAVENFRQWQSILPTAYRNCHVQFALKACKSASLLRAFADEGAGADVSSAQEMTSALMNLVPARRMSMTGPAKTDYEICLCLRHGVVIHVDCTEELNRILALSKAHGQPAQLFLRTRPISEPNSRFGMTEHQMMACLPLLAEASIDRIGFSFHLNDYHVCSRSAQLRSCIAFARDVQANGFEICGIDIGGGYPMRYLPAFDASSYNRGDHWAKTGRAGSYPYASDLCGPFHAAAVIRDALSDPANRGFMEDHRVPILLQPGRSLLDQCGLTAFDVIEVKSLGDARHAVVLDGMSFSLSETWFGSDFVPTPVILRRAPRTTTHDDKRYFLVGRSCLESDVIRWRGLAPKGGIARGDLVVFVNTGGYQMDSNESTFHQIPLPKKIAAVRHASGWKVFLDEHMCKGGINS